MNEKTTTVPNYTEKIIPPEVLTSNAPVVSTDQLADIIAELMRPVMQTIGKMLENNTAALEQIAGAQSITNDRIDALERQIRLQTPVTGKQVSYLNDAIRMRSRELLDKHGITDRKAITKLGNAIRKAVLSRYGVASLREIPKHEYNVAMSQVGTWNDLLTVRDAIKEAREREKLAELSASADGKESDAGQMDKPRQQDVSAHGGLTERGSRDG